MQRNFISFINTFFILFVFFQNTYSAEYYDEASEDTQGIFDVRTWCIYLDVCRADGGAA